MNQIKKILFKLLSQRAYLRILHRSFYFLYDAGFLKNDARFKYHYMVKNLIQPTDTVVDIGANLGYFTKNFARLASKGKVVSIEPVPIFFETLSHFMQKFPNSERYNVALGTEKGKITMVMPTSNGMIRTGLPHIAESEEEKKQNATQEVEIVKGSELLSKLDKIDYIKCDIEGYEWTVFQEIKPLIEKFHPYIQLEIADKNKNELVNMLKELGYTQYGIANFKFVKEENGNQQEEGDYFFVPVQKAACFEQLITDKKLK